jgi:GTP diphosphokinase / guanosine-3',5'-bis(diphosphate) 3'-diphosphatase
MTTLDRVLPWRRSDPPVSEAIAPLVTAFHVRHPKAPVERIERAYQMAERAHRDQYRKSGERYINHPMSVALIIASQGLDDVTIAAALLHDAVEDTDISLADVEAACGADVAHIVDGVTKLERIRFDSKEEQQAATMRKMLVAMAKDLRVLMIKLADRLHNMRTIAGFSAEKQHRIASETLDIYAPLAHRLGMGELKQELEDLSFAAIHPKRYAEIDHMVSTRSPERDTYLALVIEQVRARLGEVRIDADIYGRGKHLWSIYDKMVGKAKSFDDIYDLVAIRVIVDSIKDCYAALGSIHAQWKPIQGRFKDYIAMPKFNLYQSLHTTVIGPQGKPIEVQIRTREMHHRAEYGIAAHYSYKDGSDATDLAWLNRLVDWQAEVSDPAQFMESLKTDLDQDEVFTFTPKGKVVTLPVGATPIDFAYAVHTEVGHACIGARVNGRLVSLDQPLSSGDSIEIITSKVTGAGPSPEWMTLAQSPRARSKMKAYFSRGKREDTIDEGQMLLAEALGAAGLPARKLIGSEALARAASALGLANLEALYHAIGSNEVATEAVVGKLDRQLHSATSPEQLPTPAGADRGRRRTVGVHIEGMTDVVLRLSKCCTPVPGDDIIGFSTRGRGVSVHRTDCSNFESLREAQAGRVLEAEWDNEQSQSTFIAAVEVKALDRSRLLRDVANAMSDHQVNIVACSTHTGNDRVAKMRFEFELASSDHLEAVLRTIKQIESVYDAYRIVPGKTG